MKRASPDKEGLEIAHLPQRSQEIEVIPHSQMGTTIDEIKAADNTVQTKSANRELRHSENDVTQSTIKTV